MLLHRRRGARVLRSFTRKPNGSNSTETKLSVVRRRTKIRFIIILGANRTLLSLEGGGEVEVKLGCLWIEPEWTYHYQR
ncbi:hypothetical protein HanIR_Chr02g0093141 [Helianthus annuus]|nr:hypothetical protein HanIR_Chr02g0093141 [Helianthus annuus]